ncbi:MAG: PilZ domain-containing protein [Parvularculaceae bacterium]
MPDSNATGTRHSATPHEDASERRRHRRVDMNLKARVLMEDGVEEPCIVVNISAGGAMLKARTPPPEGAEVIVYIDDIGRFKGKVVRSSRHVFAVDYRGRKAKTKRTADALTYAANHTGKRFDRRGSPRIRQDAPALVRLENGDTLNCAILDISLTGASIAIEPRPPLGALLTVGRMNAKVVRRHETGVGVVFTGTATKMEEVIESAKSQDETKEDGPQIAGKFGKKGV